uniref:Protein suppressor of underreplication n=1 Tax=Zeugodacus cucurbitae TaxID=28588 RepID=A0A0A1WUM5_ZEUCU
MYHFMATCAPEPLELSEKVQIPGHVRQYLKDFQLETLRFLHRHLANRDFCILNDESGLGKCVSTAVYLGVIAKNKTCLIVVQNDDELVAGWQFHFDILTNLTVGVLDSTTSILDSPPNIIIAKWATLRSTVDGNKYNYDYIIIDNRGQMMSNNFCMSMLLSNYEHKVNLLISSIDVTSDLKLLHNALRLGGRIDHQYEQFKVFEAKYKLPDSKDVLNKTSDLEQYFLKREMISDYCKDFRLRRYRHQFEDNMPLVNAERYKINLDLWHTISSSNSSLKSNDNTNVLNANSETATEELFNQALALNGEMTHITETQKSEAFIMPNNEPSEDALSMSPLLIDSESCDSDEAEVVVITNQETSLPPSKQPVSDIYEFVDLSTENCSEEYVSNINRTKQKTPNKSEASQLKARSPAQNNKNIKTIIIKDTQEIENPTDSTKNQANRKKTKLQASKDVLEKKTNVRKGDQSDDLIEVLDTPLEASATIGDSNKNATVSKRQMRNNNVIKQNVAAESQIQQDKDNNKDTITTSNRRTLKQPKKYLKQTANKIITTDKSDSVISSKQKKLEQAQKNSEKTSKITDKVVERKIREKLTEAKQQTDKAVKEKDPTPKEKNDELKEKEIKFKHNVSEAKETPRRLRQTRANKTDVPKDKNVETSGKVTPKKVESAPARRDLQECDKDKEKTPSKDSPQDEGVKQNAKPKIKNKSRADVPETPTVRNTRSMQQRLTRSKDNMKSKYMKSPLLPDSNRKPKKKPKEKAILTENCAKAVTKEPAEPTSKSKKVGSENLANEHNTNICRKTTQNKGKKGQTNNIVSNNVINTTDSAILPCSNNTEDMQCGQKIISDTHSDNEFLRPPTPVRNTRNSEPKNFLPTPSSLTDSEVVFVPSTDVPNKGQSIVVLSSSTDDGSLSSQQSAQSRRTRALKQKKALKRPAIDAADANQLPSTPTFGELLAKQRAQRKSPDLFSASTELGLTCTQRTTDDRHDGVETFQGFKIFGSEVKQMQQQHAQIAGVGKKTKQALSRGRSCLNILEQMFDTPATEVAEVATNAQTQPTKSTNTQTTKSKKAPDSKLVKRATRGSQPVMPALPNAVTGTQNHEKNKQTSNNGTATNQMISGPMEDEEIFEITHNDAFGSVMRINSNGEISPVQMTARTQPTQPTQHNKITNYLIGTTQLTPTEATMDERTPSKRTPQTQLSGTAARRSPKHRSTQSTKLTKWFQKNDALNDLHANAAQQEITSRSHNRNTMAKRLKRRCLELSFRN